MKKLLVTLMLSTVLFVSGCAATASIIGGGGSIVSIALVGGAINEQIGRLHLYNYYYQRKMEDLKNSPLTKEEKKVQAKQYAKEQIDNLEAELKKAAKNPMYG